MSLCRYPFRRIRYRRLTLLILLGVFAFPLLGNAQAYRGKDFWICFPQNARLENHYLLEQRIYIAAEGRTHGQIDDLADGTTRLLSVEAGASTFLELDTIAQITENGRALKKSFHITTDHDISLYVISHRVESSDSYAAIPTPLLGTDYVVAAAGSSDEEPMFQSQCEFIATEDNTQVSVKLSAATSDGMPAGRTLNIPMNRGEVFQIQGSQKQGRGDLTGSIVHSTKPIAFFTGHRCAEIPINTLYCNLLVEMEPPAQNFGTEFVLAKWAAKPNYSARVTSVASATEVSLNGKALRTLEAGEFLQLDSLRSDALIRTSKPALVTQFITSFEADPTHFGDPSMTIVTPKSRFAKEYTAVTMTDGRWRHFLNLVVEDSGLTSLRIDGMKQNLELPETSEANRSGEGRPSFEETPISAHSQMSNQALYSSGDKLDSRPIVVRKIPNTNCNAITIEVTSGRHLLRCDVPFAAYSYGYGLNLFDSYSHSCGEELIK